MWPPSSNAPTQAMERKAPCCSAPQVPEGLPTQGRWHERLGGGIYSIVGNERLVGAGGVEGFEVRFQSSRRRRGKLHYSAMPKCKRITPIEARP